MRQSAVATKERILDAAQSLVMKQGFSATSVDQIQEAASISRGTFFYHFPTKDDLARTLLTRYADTDRVLTDEFMERSERLARSPLHQVLVFLGLHEEMFRDMAGEYPGCLFASYSYEAGLFDSATHAVIESSVEHWRQIVGGKLKDAIKEREPAVPVDPYVLADLGYSVLQGAYILSRVEGDVGIMIEHLGQFRTYLELLFGEIEASAVLRRDAEAQ